MYSCCNVNTVFVICFDVMKYKIVLWLNTYYFETCAPKILCLLCLLSNLNPSDMIPKVSYTTLGTEIGFMWKIQKFELWPQVFWLQMQSSCSYMREYGELLREKNLQHWLLSKYRKFNWKSISKCLHILYTIVLIV